MVTLPRTTKCIVVQQSKNTAASPSHFLYDSCLVERPLPAPKHHEVVVKIGAAGFNQKEIWIRRGLYPGIKVGAVYGTDGAGTVVASGMPNDTFIDKRVMLLPMRGWHSDPRAPETRFGTIGGGSFPPLGSFAEFDQAIFMGEKGGANYTQVNWPYLIHSLLEQEGRNVMIDSIIDSGGGEIMITTEKILRKGGRVVCCGMTSTTAVTMTMRQVLANQQLLDTFCCLVGSTAGSCRDLRDATDFVTQHRIVPVVSDIVDGLECADDGFNILGRGDQFGKVVIKVMTPVSLSKL